MLQELFGSYPVEYKHTKVGQLTVSGQGLMARFICECVVATAEVLRLAVLAGDHYVVLGVLLPDGDKLRFTKQYSKNDLRLKNLTSIDACRLISKHDALLTAPAPRIEPEWEPAREIGDNKILYTHATKITINEAPAVAKIPKEVSSSGPKRDPVPKAEPIPVSEATWTPHPDPGILFTDPDLIAASAYVRNAMTRPCGNDCIELAVPFESGKSFPLLPIFCSGTAAELNGGAHLVFRIKHGTLVK